MIGVFAFPSDACVGKRFYAFAREVFARYRRFRPLRAMFLVGKHIFAFASDVCGRFSLGTTFSFERRLRSGNVFLPCAETLALGKRVLVFSSDFFPR